VLNFVGALVLGSLLADGIAAELGGLVAFVQGIYWLLLGYGTALGVPLVRYFWIQWRNSKISDRNQQRRMQQLESADNDLQQKIAYARQFAAETVIGQEWIWFTPLKPICCTFRTNRRRVAAEIVRFLRSDHNP